MPAEQSNSSNPGKGSLLNLDIVQFKKAKENGAVVIDTRPSHIFTSGYIPGALFLGTDGKYIPMAKSMFPDEQPFLIVSNLPSVQNIETSLAELGFKNIIGFLEGGFDTWKGAGEPIDMIIDVEPDELMMDIPFDENLMVLDVRKELEYAEGHLANACNIPLNEFADPAKIAQLEESANIYLHCAGGNRSIIAASILKRHGLNNIRNVLGGWNKIKAEKKAEIVKEGKILN